MIATIRLWKNVLKRIYYFSRMYPLKQIFKDAFLFPVDYFVKDRDINTVRNITMSITHRCNIKCTMCYYHLNLYENKDMTMETFTKIIDQVAPSRPGVLLNGGEPFMHKGLVDFIRYAKSKKLPVQIFTNGTLMKPEVMDELFELGLDYLNVTLLGNREIHDQIALVKGSYDRLVNNLTYAAKHKKKTKIILNYTITPESIDSLQEPVRLAQELDLDGVRYQHYNFLTDAELMAQQRAMKQVMNAENSQTNEVIQQNDVTGMGPRLKLFASELKSNKFPVQWAPTLSEDEIDNWYSQDKFKTKRTCIFAWRGLQVEYDGTLNPCSKIYNSLGNIAQEDVFKVWNSQGMKTFRNSLKKRPFPACSRCCKL